MKPRKLTKQRVPQQKAGCIQNKVVDVKAASSQSKLQQLQDKHAEQEYEERLPQSSSTQDGQADPKRNEYTDITNDINQPSA